jgi:acyl-CoA thioester hydrolase
MNTPLPQQIDLCATVKTIVPFHDADPAGVAWHGNHLKYFDLARCALLDVIGYGYKEMARGGHYWPVVEANLRYVLPLPYHSPISVTARLVEWEFRLKIDYEIFDAEGQRAALGQTTQVAVDARTGVMQIGAPERLSDCLRAWLSGERGRH